MSLAEVTEAFIKRYGSEYDRPINTRYIGTILRRVLEMRPYKSDGIYRVGLNRKRLAGKAAQFGVVVDDEPQPDSET